MPQHDANFGFAALGARGTKRLLPSLALSVGREGAVGSYKDYRDKALECLDAADRISDPQERLALLEIAQSWMRLAKRVAAREAEPMPSDEKE